MADPLSVLGTAVGVTSLIIQLADECIKGYKFYGKVLGMPEEYRYIRVRLQMEQQRFLNFALEARMLYTDNTLCATLQVNRSLLLAALAEVKAAFETCVAKNRKYVESQPQGDINWDDHQEPDTDLMELLCLPQEDPAAPDQKIGKRFKLMQKLGRGVVQSGKNIRTVVMEPKRLVWAASDQSSFDDLLKKMADLNSFLIALLDGSQIERLQNAMDISYQEILQIRNDVKSLTGLLQALEKGQKREDGKSTFGNGPDNALAKRAAEETEIQKKKRRYLQRLTEIKIQYSRLGGQIDAVLSTKEPLEWKLFTPEELKEGKKFPCRENGIFKDQPVWIEWKDTSAMTPRTRKKEIIAERQKKIENRIRLLAELLCDEKPEGFHSPPCLGYVKVIDDDDQHHYGIVFDKSARGASTTELRTLHELLQARPKPSLSTRLSLCALLAECIYSFHAVNWLHKGMRSDNILFFAPKDGQADLCKPYVSGFELSRPSEFDALTEKPDFNPAHDICRHPLAQSTQSGSRYRKSYDIYALAITLVEIANWKTIDTLLGFQKIETARPPELREVHKRLLDEPVHFERIARKVGSAFREVVSECLGADQKEKEIEEGESDASIAMRLQRMLDDEVLKKLRKMEAATGGEKV